MTPEMNPEQTRPAEEMAMDDPNKEKTAEETTETDEPEDENSQKKPDQAPETPEAEGM